MVPLTWAGLIEWQTIKVPVVVQVGPRPHLRGLLASGFGPIVAGPRRGAAQVLVSTGVLVLSVMAAGLVADASTGDASDRIAGRDT
jgi:hypothetical protein